MPVKIHHLGRLHSPNELLASHLWLANVSAAMVPRGMCSVSWGITTEVDESQMGCCQSPGGVESLWGLSQTIVHAIWTGPLLDRPTDLTLCQSISASCQTCHAKGHNGQLQVESQDTTETCWSKHLYLQEPCQQSSKTTLQLVGPDWGHTNEQLLAEQTLRPAKQPTVAKPVWVSVQHLTAQDEQCRQQPKQLCWLWAGQTGFDGKLSVQHGLQTYGGSARIETQRSDSC